MEHFFIVPTLACPAECKYCFGPHEGDGIMDLRTVNAIIDWQKTLGKEHERSITFHGGEPLSAGIDFFRTALPLLKSGFSPVEVEFGIQSNLWLLTDEFIEMFREYNFCIGTSLDGPEHINDLQRGTGYFKRTMAGIELARKHGMKVNCISTFTKQSSLHYKEIFDFFKSQDLNFSIHPAIPSIRYSYPNEWTLSTQAYGELMERMIELYSSKERKIRIGTLDAMIKSVSTQQGGICTFSQCLGEYLTVGPDGSIYTCQRFAGMKEYSVGNVHNCPSIEEIELNPIWKMLDHREKNIKAECGCCTHFEYCMGGCPYNALTEGGGNFDKTMRDPLCKAYRNTLSLIMDKAIKEFFSEENLDAIINSPNSEEGLLRRGKLISIMKGVEKLNK